MVLYAALQACLMKQAQHSNIQEIVYILDTGGLKQTGGQTCICELDRAKQVSSGGCDSMQTMASPAAGKEKLSHHDRNQGAHNWQRGGLTKNHLGQNDTENWFQCLHSVGQTDGHSCKRQVGSHMSNGMHGGRSSNLLELTLGDRLQEAITWLASWTSILCA